MDLPKLSKEILEKILEKMIELNDIDEDRLAVILEMVMDTEIDGQNGGRKNNRSTSLYKRAGTKTVFGKNKVIYKIIGSNKEYIRSKGKYIHISEYKKRANN